VNRVTYRLLGDDIVIIGTKAAQAYEDLLELLKIPQSKQKTIRSKEGFEFVKRRFYKGTEVTPAPMKAILDKNVTYAGYELIRVAKHITPDGVDMLEERIGSMDPSVHVIEQEVRLSEV